jgi:hypothetical protein
VRLLEYLCAFEINDRGERSIVKEKRFLGKEKLIATSMKVRLV